MSPLEIRPVADEAEDDRFVGILADCFTPSANEEGSRKWRARIPVTDRLVVRRDDRVVATIVQVPMSQWFGGRAVPTMGVAGVGVDPYARGGGLATEMMTTALRQWRAAGWPISTLYPSTYRLYRGVGYERAGSRWRLRLRLSEVDVRERGLSMRALGAEDGPRMASLRDRFGARTPGTLQRGDYLWSRVQEPQGVASEGGMFLAEDGQPEGYVVWQRLPSDEAPYGLSILDAVVTTPRAGRALLSFVGSFRTIADEAVLSSAPNDPLLHLLPERRYQLKLADQWMVRILDVQAALEARGYAPAVSAELHLRVTDPRLPENEGAYVLRVDGGRGRVERGGEGRVALSARALAPLFTGHLDPEALALTGELVATPEDRALAAGVFAGPAPWMADMF